MGAGVFGLEELEGVPRVGLKESDHEMDNPDSSERADDTLWIRHDGIVGAK